MNRKIFSALSTFVLFFWSCSKPEQPHDEFEATAAFNKLYPLATSTKTTTQREYVSFTFNLSGKEASAWFASNGTWITTTITHPANDIPSGVSSTVSRQYPSTVVDNVYQYSQINAPDAYIINVDHDKTWDAFVILENGLMIDRFADHYWPKLNDAIPILALTDILSRYPQSVAFNMVEYIDDYFGVYVLSNNRVKYVLYNAQDEWVQSYHNITKAEIPAAVSATLNTNNPQSSIVVMRFYTTSKGEFYRIILLDNNDTYQYENLKADGTPWG